MGSKWTGYLGEGFWFQLLISAVGQVTYRLPLESPRLEQTDTELRANYELRSSMVEDGEEAGISTPWMISDDEAWTHVGRNWQKPKVPAGTW